MDDNKRRYVTANYAQLQGLRLMPIGVFLLVFYTARFLGFTDPAGLSSGERARFLTRMGFAFWLALGLALVAPLYYRYRYGSVQGLDRGRRNTWITAAVVGFFVLTRMDNRLHWPVSLSLLLVSTSLFVTAWHEGWIRPYYPAVAVMWLTAGCLPALGVPHPDMRLTLSLLGGLTFIVIGVGDHVLLSRALVPPPRSRDVWHPPTV